MPATGSFPWRCNNCGSVNDGGQLTCTLCGGPYTSGDPPGPLPALAHRPGKGRTLRRFFLIGLTVSLVGGWVFAYFSYTPFRTLHTFQMSNTICSIAWSPDSRVFAAVTCGQGFGDGMAMVSIWRASDGRQLYTYSYPSAPSGSSQLAWTPDGSSFAIAWADGNVNIWRAANDYSSWHEQSSFHFHFHYSPMNRSLTGLVWSADGKHLVMSYLDGQLHVWDTVGGHALPPVRAPGVAPQMSSILALSPDGTQAILKHNLAGGKDATYATWDLTTGKVILLPSQNLLNAHAVWPYFAWSADGKALAASDGKKVLTWQWNQQGNNWTFVRSMDVGTPNGGITALTWSPDRKRLATADVPEVIRMWSASSGALLGPFRLPLYDPPVSRYEVNLDTELAWSPNGAYLLAANFAEQVILRLVLWR
jgi:WD40 repeat protein